MKLDDQFEWDIENSEPTPEQFADIYSSDLGLAGEFKFVIPLIASLRFGYSYIFFLGLPLPIRFVSK